MINSNFIKIVKLTLPVFFGYIAIGIPFGLMLVKNGYPWWLSPVMSLTMYAGAGEYMAIGLFASGASFGAIAVAELLLNIRHIVYGLSLIEKFKDTGKWKPYLVFALTDETYALMTSIPLPVNAFPSMVVTPFGKDREEIFTQFAKEELPIVVVPAGRDTAVFPFGT